MIHGGDRERPDEALVAACLDGQAGAWEELVRRHAALVHSIARRSGLGNEDADEVFQTTYVLAWRNLGLLDRPAALGGWIATIARREAWRLRRRRAGETERTDDDAAAAEQPAAAPLPDEALAALERRALLERALERLDERCAALVRLLFFEEPPPAYADAARRLGMPIGSLGPTRGRCLEKLRRNLERIGGDVFTGGDDDSTDMETS